MFGVETEEDLLKAMFNGVWSTKGGQEYLKRREGKLNFNVDSLLDDILGKEKSFIIRKRRSKSKSRRAKSRLKF